MATLRRTRAGVTLVELMIALVVGLVVVGSSLSFAATSLRAVTGSDLREDMHRGARFIGMSLERDLSETGVALHSTPQFGTLLARADSMVTIRVPFEPAQAPVYGMRPGLPTPVLPGAGTCGTSCLDLNVDVANGQTWQIRAGDIAMMTVDHERRLLNVLSAVRVADDHYRLTFTDADTLFLHPAGWAPPIGSAAPLQLNPAQTSVQRVAPVLYYRDNRDRLIRAARLDPTDVPVAEVVAEGVTRFEAWLHFVDGDSARTADPLDGDATNDFNQLLGVSVVATLQAASAARTVGDGTTAATRTYAWRYSPRNLIYERNR